MSMTPAELAATRERLTWPHGDHCVHDIMRLIVTLEQLKLELDLERLRWQRAEFQFQAFLRGERRAVEKDLL
jgi:hypothetical protein